MSRTLVFFTLNIAIMEPYDPARLSNHPRVVGTEEKCHPFFLIKKAHDF
jgi:hypothetical protein